MKNSPTELEELKQSLTSAEKENASKHDSSYEETIIQVKKFDEPIDMIETTEGWFLAIGKTALSDKFKTEDEAIDFTTTWKFAINLMIVINTQVKQIEQIQQAKINNTLKK